MLFYDPCCCSLWNTDAKVDGKWNIAPSSTPLSKHEKPQDMGSKQLLKMHLSSTTEEMLVTITKRQVALEENEFAITQL